VPRPIRPVLLGVLAVLGLAAPPARARERIDLVQLVGGDRITGEIIRLESANLSVRTRLMGTVDIDWPDVVGLVSIQYFEVERADGLRVRGGLDVADAGGALVVRRGPETEPVVIPFAEVVGIDQLGSNLWRGRRGHVDLGWTFAQADSDSNLSIDAELALKVRRWRWVSSLSTTVSDDDDTDRDRRDQLQSALEIPISRRTELVAWAQHERNDDLDLRARDTLAGAFFWLPVNGPRGRLAFGPGLAESRESYFSLEDESTVASGLLAFWGEYHRFGSFGTKVSIGISWLPVFSGPDRDRVEAWATFRQKLGSNFTFSVNPYYSYDSLPPTASAPGEDWGWTSAIGWDF
jgi:hypothetical protein